ncbi:MAG: hypothetical protein M3139_08200 [Bacteroidota bacterium]|nr:hypothetical protein [Bacteroidota bacterium]
MKIAITNRVFLLLFSVIIIFTAFWIYRTHILLDDISSPTRIVKLFDLNNDLLYNVVTIFSLMLLLLSNFFYWRSGNGIYFLWSVLYFIAGIISLAILENARFFYTKQNGLFNGKISSGFVVSTYLILIVIVVTIIDFFIIRYWRNKNLSNRKKI